MKNIITFFFGLILTLGHGQTVYTSPITENLNTQQVEQIERTITIGDKFIVIESVIDDTSSDIQQLKILGIEQNLDTHGGNMVYKCTSYDGKYPTIIIVYEEMIYAIQPLKDGSGDETMRFLLD